MKPHSPEWEAALIKYRPQDLELRRIRNEREDDYYADVAAYGHLPVSVHAGVLRDVLRLYAASPGMTSAQTWTDQNIFRVGKIIREEGASDWVGESFIAQMRRIGRNKNARPLDPPIYSTKKAVKDPYRPAQYEAWWRLVAAQPNPSTALQLAVVLCLSLGAGASPKDLRLLTWGDILIDEDRATVDVRLTGTPQERQVPVCEPWATRLVDTIGDRPTNECHSWAIGTDSRQTNMLSTFGRAVRWGGQEPFGVSRLRTTWIAERLSAPVRVDVLQEMLGRSTLSTIIHVAKMLTDDPTAGHYDQLRDQFANED